MSASKLNNIVRTALNYAHIIINLVESPLNKTTDMNQFKNWLMEETEDDIDQKKVVLGWCAGKNFKEHFENANRLLLTRRRHTSWKEKINEGTYEDKYETYWTEIESAAIIKYMLQHNNIDVSEFIWEVDSIMTKRNQKKNTLYLIGQPNSGKTKILESIYETCKYRGTVTSALKHNNFPFNDAINCEVLQADEFSWSIMHTPTILKVLEGSSVYVSVKNKSKQALERTPMLISGNQPLQMNDVNAARAITVRLVQYRFRSNDVYERILDKKLHPGAWKILMDWQEDDMATTRQDLNYEMDHVLDGILNGSEVRLMEEQSSQRCAVCCEKIKDCLCYDKENVDPSK